MEYIYVERTACLKVMESPLEKFIFTFIIQNLTKIIGKNINQIEPRKSSVRV
jgi:hypothetical protein